MLSRKIRILLLLMIVSPLPTAMLVGYEYWAHRHLQIKPEAQQHEAKPTLGAIGSRTVPLHHMADPHEFYVLPGGTATCANS